MSQSGTTIKPSTSTTLTTETSLSILYRVLRTIIRPLRPNLVKPGKPLPAGSPQLTKHPKSKNNVSILEHKHGDLFLYDFVPVVKTKNVNQHRILYFAGGGFQSPPASEHWSFVSKLANELSDEYRITLVSYPLAPNSPASASLPVLQKHLRHVCEEANSQKSSVTLMGDSAGGNVVLSLGFWWASELVRTASSDAQGLALTPAAEVLPPVHLNGVLKNIFVVSPAVDLRSVNPDIAEADRYDPVLNIASEEQCARAWSGTQDHPSIKHIPPSDPSISPLLQTQAAFKQMKEVGIKVHGVFGTHDVLAPDTELLRQKLVQADVPGEWLVWKGQMHCFVLAGVYGLSEGKQGIEWCVGVLRRSV